jgi:hypothetical protein
MEQTIYNNWRNQMIITAEENVRQRVRLNRNILINEPDNENVFWNELFYDLFERPINNEQGFFQNNLGLFAQANEEVRQELEMNIRIQNNPTIPIDHTVLYQTAWILQTRIGREAVETVRNEWINTNRIP